MRSFILLGSMMLLPLLSLAQTKTDKAEVRWGAPRVQKTDGSFSHVAHEKDGNIYVIVNRKDGSWLEILGPDLRVFRSQALPLEMGRNDHAWERLVFQDDRILFFTTFYDKSAKSNGLYVRSYNIDDLTPKANMQKLHAIEALGKKARGGYSVSSLDDGRVRVSAYIPIEDSEEQRRTEVLMFDRDMNPVASDAVDRVMPFSAEEFVVSASTYDTDGTYIVLGKKYPEKKEKRERRKEGKPTYDSYLLLFPPGATTATIKKLEVADVFLQDLQIRVPEEVGAPIICAGLYSSRSSYSVRGAFFLRLDRRTKEVVHQDLKEFDKDFITEYMTEKEEKKAEKKAEKKKEEVELFSYDLDGIILRDDGGAMLIGEQYRTYTTCYTDSKGNTRCVEHYLYNDIMVVSSDPEGNIEWARKIPKRQHTVNDGGFYSSYALGVKGDLLYFIFNDNGENLYVKSGMKIQQFDLKGKNALITLATVDSDGNVTREALLAPEKRDAILKPKDCTQVGDDKMFIYAQRKKESRFGYIEFK